LDPDPAPPPSAIRKPRRTRPEPTGEALAAKFQQEVAALMSGPLTQEEK